ncbi:MAG: extracellular solute-binding protein [Anaerolineales bacterium]
MVKPGIPRPILKLRAFLAVALLISACAIPPWLAPQATGEAAGPAESPPPQPSTKSTPSATSTILSVWVPPAFDPGSSTPSASLLQARFDEFSDRHPQVRIETRVKAESGTGGLLDSLLMGKIAAPLSLPDLVLLPHTQLATAVQGGVLLPLTDSIEDLGSEDWYPFAKQMIAVDGESYGTPFAGDGLVLAYRPTAVSQIPDTWEALLQSSLVLGFAAADPDAIFALFQLMAQGTEPQDSGSLLFSRENLIAFFEFLAAGEESAVFPFWLSQYQTSEQSWQAFTEGRVPMVAAWTSAVFDNRNVDILASPLPTQSGAPFTLVRGWAWAVSTARSENQALAIELVEFLSTPEFIAQWTASAGMLPTRHSSLAAWPPDFKQALASQVADSAEALPSEAVLDAWGQALTEAVVSLLKREATPEEAVQAVIIAVTPQ